VWKLKALKVHFSKQKLNHTMLYIFFLQDKKKKSMDIKVIHKNIISGSKALFAVSFKATKNLKSRQS
jgi:hypothetical protein